MSYIELYNENIRDLLNPSSGYLELREDSRGRSVQVSGLKEISTTSTDEVSLVRNLLVELVRFLINENKELQVKTPHIFVSTTEKCSLYVLHTVRKLRVKRAES